MSGAFPRAAPRPIRFSHRPDVAHGAFRLPAGHDLVIAVDTLVDGVHFPVGTPPQDIGFKALAVNLSDLAAMGATPVGACVSLIAPAAPARWLGRFRDGLEAAGAAHGLVIDAAERLPGALAVTVQVHGLVESGTALTRRGARDGDVVWVTGTVGDAGLGLAAISGRASPPPAARAFALDRLARPTARVEAGRALRGLASAAIDVSDGLAQDLGHVLEASGVGARIAVEALPLSAALRESLPGPEAARLALTAGDDYELCFTAPQRVAGALAAALGPLGCGFTRIGRVHATPGLMLAHRGTPFEVDGGYRHFA